MNCRPGDMAIITGVLPTSIGFECNGMIVQCVELFNDHYGSYSWLVNPKPRGFCAVADACLRPIRDPGDDAVDEMVQLVGEATARNA